MTIRIITVACGLLMAGASYAAPPAGAPADATGLCNDGTYYTGATKKGACAGHKGVKDWWGESTAKPAGEAKAPAPAAAPAAPAPAAAPAAAKPPAKPAAAQAAPAAGGGAGKVWVNTDSKVYHCPGDKWYGKTKQGEYMTEADAAAKGYRPDHGKACK